MQNVEWVMDGVGDTPQTVTTTRAPAVLINYLSVERNTIANATNNGEKCAKLRLIELAQTLACYVACNTPGVILIKWENEI